MVEQRDGRGDFDFLVGTWIVQHRMRRGWLNGTTEWVEFGGHWMMHKILGGAGNFDELTMQFPSGTIHGATMRLYNPETCEWSIYWASSNGGGKLLAPMVGKFEDGRGAFYGTETNQGQQIFCRFFWTHEGADKCRWEQAYSDDGGQTWEINWIMELTRVSE